MRPCHALWFVLVVCVAAARAAAPSGPASLALSDDGAYVLDAHAQVAWPRCVEGMRWTGKTCVGAPLLLNHAQAMALALDRERASGLPWRVPRVKELQGLARRSGSAPGLDAALFPAAPRGWHWSASAAIRTTAVNQYNYANVERGRSEPSAERIAFLQGWAVNLATGEARGDVTKRTRLAVRLALPLDP